MPKLTIGMAHYEDYDGVYFTIQALRLYHPKLVKEIEIVVVDNAPGSPHGQAIQGLVKHWASRGTAGSQYVALHEPVGTSPSRDKVFEVATSPWVMCIDCHILLKPGALERVFEYIDANPDSEDLMCGPLVYDDLDNTTTHFDDVWRGEMWGTWGTAWECCEGGIHFSCFEDKKAEGEVGMCGHRLLGMGHHPLTSCHKCGRDLPKAPWPGHEQLHEAAGYTRLAHGDKPFEIPGQGLGLFMMRREAWPGFNPHARGFGGEEMYIHEKVRMNGGKVLCLPELKWVHRFGRPRGVPYPLTRWNKVRNYVLEHQELGLDLDRVHEHFVASGLMTEDGWNHLLKNPVKNITELKDSCGTCPGGTQDEKIINAPNLDGLFNALKEIPRDLDKHMPRLRELASMCDHVTEVSKRKESTVALAAAMPTTLRSYQVEAAEFFERMREWMGDEVDWQLDVADSPQIDEIEETEMLFIDSTAHTFNRLHGELTKYGPAVTRFIVVHDTKLHADKGEDGGPGYLPAIRQFMRENEGWSVLDHTDRQYGLTVLGCRKEDKPKLPSTIKMAANLATALTSHVARGGGSTTKDEFEARLNECSMCPHRNEDRCSVCGCFLTKKAAMRTQPCPLGKWPTLEGEDV